METMNGGHMLREIYSIRGKICAKLKVRKSVIPKALQVVQCERSTVGRGGLLHCAKWGTWSH